MSKQTVKVPDIGTDQAAEVSEVLVSEGDLIEAEQSIIVLETDKASVEVPSSHGGKVLSILVKEGDELNTGAAILELETDTSAGAEAPTNEQPAEGAEQSDSETVKPADKDKPSAKDKGVEEKPEPQEEVMREVEVTIPDVGEGDVDVIEVSVAVGDEVNEGDSLIVLESDKASMELPSPAGGRILELLVKEGDKVREGQQVAVIQATGGGEAPAAPQAAEPAKPSAEQPKEEKPSPKKPEQAKATPAQQPAPQIPQPEHGPAAASTAYAGPAVRKLARELGVDLDKVKTSGPRGRLLKEDLRSYVRDLIERGGTGSAIPEVPAVDFSRFGEIKRVKMSKIKRATAANMHRSWLNVPHVTQFDDADITELEAYRKGQKAEAEKRGLKITPLPFILKACALTLKEEPSFNVSLDPDGEHIIEKQYIHIGVAVDTPKGLMVPVIRDVDKKTIWELAEESMELAGKARDGKLAPRDMQGGCFSVSSLGAIGGQGFTPIVNTPEVGILGVSKAGIKPFWDGKAFVPHTFLPLSLSYDHRAVNGADAGRFLTHLVSLLGNHKEWLD